MPPPTQQTPFMPTGSASLPWPPGLIGDVAKFIYETSERPVKESSIAAALALFAGICSGSFQAHQRGLNIRIMFISQSCVTEDDALRNGIIRIVNSVAASYPAITQFVDFNDYAKGAALAKALALRKFFVNVVGDFCTKLTGMTNSKNSHMVSLREAMEHPDKTTPSGHSLICKATPSTLGDMLTTSVLQSDFVHSFYMVEYTGERPQKNEYLERQLPDVLRDRVINLCQVTASNVVGHRHTPVEIDPETLAFLDAMDKGWTAEINGTKNDALRRILDKAHIKVLRVAALLAVADDCIHPVINIAYAAWAHQLVLRDVAIMIRHIDHPPSRSKRRNLAEKDNEAPKP